MISLHCSLDILTLTCGLYCYHACGNIIVIAFCNIIVVVYVVKHTRYTVNYMCRCGSKLQMN